MSKSTSTPSGRTEVNRRNAAHSTGPRTEEGKSRSSQNALRHGLASHKVVLPHESVEEYEKLKASFEDSHDIGSEFERELLGRMVDSWWRLQRAHRVEAQFLAQREQAVAEKSEAIEGMDGIEGDAALARLFTDPEESRHMRLFMRYLASAERAWKEALAAFGKERRERLALEAAAQAEIEAEIEMDVQMSIAAEAAEHRELLAHAPLAADGFVSQPAAAEPAQRPGALANQPVPDRRAA